MNVLKTKTPLNSIIFILKSHEGLNENYPEVLEIIESYLETEKKEIINAYLQKRRKVNLNKALELWNEAEFYFSKTFEK